MYRLIFSKNHHTSLVGFALIYADEHTYRSTVDFLILKRLEEQSNIHSQLTTHAIANCRMLYCK